MKAGRFHIKNLPRIGLSGNLKKDFNYIFIMAVPKRHKTSSRRDQRRMHLFITSPVLTLCQKCKKAIKPHIVCSGCGYYKGKEVIDVLSQLTKKARKQKEKDMKVAEKDSKTEKALTMEDLSKK